MDYLSDLCAGLEQQIKEDEEHASKSKKKVTRKSNNVFAKVEDKNPEEEALSEKFAAFSKVAGEDEETP